MSKPTKPKFSKGFLIYTAIAIVIWLFMIIMQFSPAINGSDWNRDGVVDYKDKYYLSDSTLEDDMLMIFLEFPLLIFSPTLIYSAYFLRKLYDYNLAQKDYPEYLRREKVKLERQIKIKEAEEAEIEVEYQAAIQSQKATEPWAVRYSTSPCPYCGHYKVRYAKWEDKSMSVAFWGIASSKIGTNYKCDHCKRMWE